MAAVYKSVAKPAKAKTSDPAERKPSVRERVLILSSRGVTYRHRHLLNDIHALLPHSRKDAKLDTKTKLYQLNEIADLYNCNNVLFFEARKAKDLYLWMSKVPNGPTVKMHMQNLHTMSELHFPGNCLKGSRPILSFDAAFQNAPHLLLIKEMFMQIFGVPPGARKSKPFVDHVMSFTLVDDKVWIRCYEVVETAISTGDALTEAPAPFKGQKSKSGDTKISLVEIGPRFVLTPIVILESSFGGPVIYENKQFVSPNQVRSQARLSKAAKYSERAEQDVERNAKKGQLGLKSGGKRKIGDLDDSVLFA